MRTFFTFAFNGVLALGITGIAMAQDNAPRGQGPSQALQGIHGPRSIDQELDHLTKDLELTPNQRKQIRPLLEEHHDKIRKALIVPRGAKRARAAAQSTNPRHQ